jgi:hypothetical protein
LSAAPEGTISGRWFIFQSLPPRPRADSQMAAHAQATPSDADKVWDESIAMLERAAGAARKPL